MEGHGDQRVPDEGEEGANQEPIDEDVVGVAGQAVWTEHGVLPVRRGGVCGGLFVGGRLLFQIFARPWFGAEIRPNAVVGAGADGATR